MGFMSLPRYQLLPYKTTCYTMSGPNGPLNRDPHSMGQRDHMLDNR